MVEQPPDQPVWLPVAQAARRLGVTQQAIRRRILRGTIETRREIAGNRSRVLVRVDQSGEHQGEHQAGPEVALLRQRVEHLEELVVDLRGERDRLLALLEQRRWPGLWPWLQRFWYGDQR